MKSPTPSGTPRKPRRRWRWHVPPALLHGNEALEGAEVLDEIPGRLGLVLWQSVRDIILWATASPDTRGELFRDDAADRRRAELKESGADANLESSLRSLAGMVDDAAGATETEVLAATKQVVAYFEERAQLGTAIAFATAAALAAPANAAAGFKVGQLARRRAEYARAESWFRRTIGLGRQAKDWASYAEAFLGLGNLYIQRGNFPAARRFHIRGLRAAKRHGLRDIQARALHDLFVIAGATQQVDEAQEYARASFRAYGVHHPRLPALAHDLALFWLERGRFGPAVGVLRAVIPHLPSPTDRLVAWGNAGRAAGGAGDRAGFDEAWNEVWSHSGDWHAWDNVPSALLALAHGAASLGEWSRAERAATTARDTAQRREEAHVALTAEAVLEQVVRKRHLDAPEPRPAAPAAEEAETLAAELIRSLALAL